MENVVGMLMNLFLLCGFVFRVIIVVVGLVLSWLVIIVLVELVLIMM